MSYEKKPKAILFDWDNTLADTWGIIHASLVKTFEAFDMEPWTFEEVKAGKNGIHQSLRNSFPRIFGDDWEHAKKIYFDAFKAVHLEKIVPMEGAKETLDFLKDKDVFLGVVSNKTGDHLRTEIEHLGWGDYFQKIVGALDAEDDKPSPAPIYFALEESNINSADGVWMIGDSTTDLEAALNADCLPLFFGDNMMPTSYHSDERCKLPIKHCKDHQELIELLKNHY